MNGKYKYIEDLLTWEYSPTPLPRYPIPSKWDEIRSPLSEKVATWNRLLSSHPDKQFMAYIMNWISKGFSIRYQRGTVKSATHNLLSTEEHPDKVESCCKKN